MVVAVIALAALSTFLAGIVAWLVSSNGKRVDQTIGSVNALVLLHEKANNSTVRAERAEYERAAATAALKAEQARTTALEEFISVDAMETDPKADLDPDDVAGRLLRFARRTGTMPWPGVEHGTGDPVRADSDASLPDVRAAGVAGSVRVP